MVKVDCSQASSAPSPFLEQLLFAHQATIKLIRNYPGVKLTQFSDSVVISSKLDPTPASFEAFLSIARSYQLQLLKVGLLCRGGISYGKHFEDDTFLFSEAVIAAYRIESQIAKFPRIVISNDLMDLIYPDTKRPKFELIAFADDNEYFVDYIDTKNIETAKKFVFLNLNKVHPSAVREKFLWLARYLDIASEKELEPIAPSSVRRGGIES